ncbi:hypothetical protein B0H17DRAFT_1134079 [Mycena rosella]|uniref:Novel STAND NTPase 1 domain-containing protein n=1 Tax=Mycena rosella TaxID=1033263 RepID=A0AAD7GH89_MYCRO|nr:hypothetical protein B0H17DRAFT_1134079 [Mycena rosella]
MSMLASQRVLTTAIPLELRRKSEDFEGFRSGGMKKEKGVRLRARRGWSDVTVTYGAGLPREIDHLSVAEIVRYSTLAASTAREIADYANVPFLQMIASLTEAISAAVQSAKSNREQCTIMMEQIHGILCTIIQLCSSYDSEGTLPPALLYDIARFTETLQKLHAFLKTQLGLGKIKQLFKQSDTATQLKAYQEELQNSLGRLKVQAGGAAASTMVQMQTDARRQHDELLALLAAHPELTKSDRSSSVTGTISSLASSSGSLSILPANPQIFHGRDLELQEILDTLKQDSPRIAILGTGGMGKTSLAVAALQHPEVINKFPNRFFIPCHSTATRSDLVSSVASYVGIGVGPNLARKIVRHLSYGPPALLILDNFETPWESPSCRTGVEEFLSLLADVAHLAIIVTMRGAERPGRVKWTRPFLGPLQPLDDDAALNTFLDIADEDHDRSRVRELLDLTGNLPLAVSLIANVVAHEGCEATLSRWQTESTRVLSDGYDDTSSLDISIVLSFTSVRMTAEAQELLSILSLLPDGLSDAELTQSNLSIPNILSAKATLIRTSLAYASRNHRFQVLVPIREHVRSTHPPSSTLRLAMRQYFRDLLDLWKQFQVMPSPAAAAQLSANLGNINAILADGLQQDAPDLVATIRAAVVLNGFIRMRNNASSPLMPLISEHVMRFPRNPVYGTYFIDKFFASRNHPIQDPDAQLALANRYFDHASAVEKAQWYNALAAYYSSRGNAIESLRHREMVISMTDSLGHLTQQRMQALTGMANTLCSAGNYIAGRMKAQQAQHLGEIIGDSLNQAQAIGFEARCCLSIGDFKASARLCRSARELLHLCGLQGTDVELRFQNFEAEIHLLKTEYPEARAIHAQLGRRTPADHSNAFDLLNLAVIDVVMGADPAAVRKNLDQARLQFTTTAPSPQAILLCDAVHACLKLREGDPRAAREMFEPLFVKLRTRDEGAIFCLERLADSDHGMHDVQSTLRWAGVYLASALKTKNKLSIMKALRCLGQIAGAEGDDSTASSLFQVALDGFTFMDVHWWRADCMVRIGEISIGRGELSESRRLFESARVLFESHPSSPTVTLSAICKLPFTHVEQACAGAYAGVNMTSAEELGNFFSLLLAADTYLQLFLDPELFQNLAPSALLVSMT